MISESTRLKNNQRAKEWRQKNQERHRKQALNYYYTTGVYNRHGVSKDWYENQFKLQAGVCAICKNQCIKSLSIDHCHNTGKVRGLLCMRCNVSLGNFYDDINLLESAITYLKEHNDRTYITP